MKKILVVDDLKTKTDTLADLVKKLDPEGKNFELVMPITPRTSEQDCADESRIIDSLNGTPDLNIYAAIIQDKNLGDCKGYELLREYRKRNYKGPIILFTASDWSWYKDDAKHDIARGFTDVFPWNTSEQEQLDFLKKY